MPEDRKPFACGGLLGSILELNRLCGADPEDLHKKDQEWADRLRISREHEA